jgi:peptidoglycan-associated lipoprotein
MQRIAWMLCGAGLAVVLAGCPPTYPKCNSDAHCKDKGEVCVQGQCQECATDANCKEGFVCEGNRCVPKPECTPTGNECGPNQKCRAGRCVVHECEQDADCASGRCVNNRCIGGCTSDDDCGAGQICRGGQCVSDPSAGRCSYEPVRFDFNEANLTGEARNRLEQIADCIKSQGIRVTLEGHADERGTEEYNLQLSNRRAESVRRYLVTLGVKANQLDTVGYGENRPVASGSSEDAWAANRRVEFNRR